MRAIVIQIERLRRHYDVSVSSYDEISLLDLAHALRICTELKEPLAEKMPKLAQAPLFKTSVPTRKLMKLASRSEHVMCCIPGGVKSYAGVDHMYYPTPNIATDTEYYYSHEILHGNDGADYLMIRNYYAISNVNGDRLRAIVKDGQVKRLNYSQWMNAEIVRMAYVSEEGKLEKIAISREMLIKRVANVLQGSHTQSDTPTEKQNKFDIPVRRLMESLVLDLPLPYILLLKIAQDILEIMSRRIVGEPVT